MRIDLFPKVYSSDSVSDRMSTGILCRPVSYVDRYLMSTTGVYKVDHRNDLKLSVNLLLLNWRVLKRLWRVRGRRRSEEKDA